MGAVHFRLRPLLNPATVAAMSCALAAGYFWGAHVATPEAARAVKPYHLVFGLAGTHLAVNLTAGALGAAAILLLTALFLAALVFAIGGWSQKKRTERANRKLREEIGERERAEEALRRANAELTQFAYVAAHDLKEPLRNVTTALGIFERRYRPSLDAEARELVGDSVEGARRLHQMVNNLLELTTVVGRLPTRADPVDTNLVIQKVLNSFRTEILARKAEVSHSFLPMVPVEEGHLHELFRNLVGNSLKYSRGGVPPSIAIAAEHRDSGWMFSITDNGIGFDPVFAEDIFTIFKRLHQRDEYPGNGIGLAICSRIVCAYGGSIWAEGRPNEGATFRFILPAVAGDV